MWLDAGSYIYPTNYSDFVITDGGNVGIGTTNPLYKLQIAGDIVPTATTTYDLGTDALRWDDLYLSGGSLYMGVSGNESILTYDGSRFGIDPDGDAGEPEFIILDDGNVGIGTTNPTEKLSVGASSQFQVNSTGNIVKINDVATSFPSSPGRLSTATRCPCSASGPSWRTATPIRWERLHGRLC